MSHNFIVHGWRDINHSFSIVNQNQLYYLSKNTEINLFHFDEKKYNSNWSKFTNSANLRDYKAQVINNISIPKIDCYNNSIVYSIIFPFMTYFNKGVEKKIYHFIVTEFGLTTDEIIGSVDRIKELNNSNQFIITPSKWSSNKIIDCGFNSEKVIIVPHGIDKDNFFPLDELIISQLRSSINLTNDSFCFLNLGSMTYNKGIDILIEAYAILFSKYPNIKIILKDQNKLYGLKAEQIINDILKNKPILDSSALRESIIVISDNLTTSQMNSLYNLVDCYISPYRAEGFNLPVLEAMACGCHVITTSGGSTDDFVNFQINDWYKIDSIKSTNNLFNSKYLNSNTNYHLVPSLDSIISNMEIALKNKNKNLALSKYIIDNYDWEIISHDLINKTI